MVYKPKFLFSLAVQQVIPPQGPGRLQKNPSCCLKCSQRTPEMARLTLPGQIPSTLFSYGDSSDGSTLAQNRRSQSNAYVHFITSRNEGTESGMTAAISLSESCLDLASS